MVAPDRQRLRRAFGLDREAAVASAATASLRAFLQRRQSAFAAPRSVVALPAGEELCGDHGPFWCRTLRYPLDHRHGSVVLGDARAFDRARLAALCRSSEFASLELEQCLFLDTETTGLSGGAGTIVFTIGLAFFAAEELVFEQLFLRDFGEELAMLQHVVRRLDERPVPVSYVGKSFDRHRLAARCAVHRLGTTILGAPHLDLYHLARRRWQRELPDCRLRTVEQLRLGLQRCSDLPGSEAPAAFLDWIRDRTGPVDRVLEHNRLDVLSVVALLAVLGGGSGGEAP